jgi:hypothetical protein
MAISPFIFSSENLPKLKAKQLSKNFRFLKLSAAQEATARSLGYSSWYECIQKGVKGQASPSDQEAGIDVRVARYYHQAGVLLGIGVTPAEADRWVRAWGLTGHPTMDPSWATPMYYKWNDLLEGIESGRIDENVILEEFGEAEYSKYPDIDRPQRVCPGVILGPLGKYPHYAVDPKINATIPIYLRGPQPIYHCEDGVDLLGLCIRGFPETKGSPYRLDDLSPVQYEWHFGEKHPDMDDLLVPKLVAAAMERPDVMMVISQRAMPIPGGTYDFNKFAVACLRGIDFATYLLAKGVIDPSTVIWFKDVEPGAVEFGFREMLFGHFWNDDGNVSLPVLREASKYKPCLPIYAYPFMKAPMSREEYGSMMEMPCLIPLDQDLGEDGDDFEEDDGDPEDPQGPKLERVLSELEPA